jgi:SAM-dependent methyltransferase
LEGVHPAKESVLMDKNYYKEYYHLERNHWWFRARGEILMDHLRPFCRERRDLKILNVGAATGGTSELLTEFGEVQSIEYDADCYQFTHDHVAIPIQQGSILDLPFPDHSFDLVCAFDVLEHIEDDRRGAAELERVCRPNGLVCVTVPAFMFLWSKHDDVNHHVRRYTKGQVARLFASRLQPVFQSYFNGWLFPAIASFRLLSSLWPFPAKHREDAGSDFFVMKSPWLERLFYRVFRSERFFLNRKIPLPAGVSILLSMRKAA